MTFDWADFLKLAEGLLRDPNSLGPAEASLRSAISRAYYAAFHAALRLECAKGGYASGGYGTDHVTLPRHLQASTDVARRQVGVDLDRLRLNRRQADYDDTLKGEPTALAQSSVEVAKELLSSLDTM